MFNVIPELLYKVLSLLLPLMLCLSGNTSASLDYSNKLGDPSYPGLAAVYEDYFPIGAAVYSHELSDPNLVDFIKKNYNSITPEWELKQSSLNPEEGVWNFDGMDALANFARTNNLRLRGHTLMWPVQDTWMLWTDAGKTTLVSKEVLFERMEAFIKTVMARYGDVIDIWDVVNEPFHYDKSQELKEETNYFKIAGEEFVTKAFELADKYSDENDVLMVNETFVLGNSGKTNNLLNCVTRWKQQGVRIDGIGLQGHMGTISTVLFDPNFNCLNDIVKTAKGLGMKVEITELDIKIYEIARQRTTDAPPKWLELWQINKYKTFFRELRENKDTIIGVTFWGLDDAHSVITYDGKKDWPMLFDVNGMPKQNFYAACDF